MTWFNALGHEVPIEAQEEALKLLTSNGLNLEEGAIIIAIVAREIKHDNPDRAQRILRGWLPEHGSETLLMMVLATLGVGAIAGHVEEVKANLIDIRRRMS